MCQNRSVSKAFEVALIIRQSHTYAYSATHDENKVTCWSPSADTYDSVQTVVEKQLDRGFTYLPAFYG